MIPTPAANWTEPQGSGAAVALGRVYWHYDAGTSTYTLTPDRSQANVELVQIGGVGPFVFVALGAHAGDPRKTAASKPSGTLIYTA